MKHKRSTNYSKWYNEIVIKSKLAEFSGVRGLMTIRPYGYALWERIKSELDSILKNTGHKNVYFPLLISKSILSKERKHISIFFDGCAIVTHNKIKRKKDKIIVDAQSKLKEELIIRPTSESIIWQTYKRWIKSYRDLPILLNQWGNAIRWEMRTRLFLRTTEFLWQEGHTAHKCKNDAIKETKKIINIYNDFSKKILAIPVIQGIKPYMDTFHGSEITYCIEAIMQDGKALQMGTVHFLGQNFSKAFDVKFTDYDGVKKYVWATSWGISTRLIGGIIMSHSDDKGLIIPPKIAPIQVVIIPIIKNNNNIIDIFSKKIFNRLKINKIRVKYDDRNIYTPGWKFNEYEMKGIPIRITIGDQEIENNTVEIFRRDTYEKIIIPVEDVINKIIYLLKEIQNNIYKKASIRTKKSIIKIDNYNDFKNHIKNFGGFILSHWNGEQDTGKIIQKETEATIRCIPLLSLKEKGKCIFSGEKSTQRVIFAKAY